MRKSVPGFVAAATLAALASPLVADDAPWAETAIERHVGEGEFTGSLDRETLLELIARGEALFGAQFTELDGLGRPMATQAIIPTKRKRPPAREFHRTAGLDANSCASCHRDPVMGGAGDFSVNVFVSEGFTNADFDTTDPQFSNERNTNHLMGAGLIELLAREMTADLHAIRANALRQARQTGEPVKADLVTKGVEFGAITAQPDGIVDLADIEGVDTDLVIRPFSQKGVMTSLRQFTVNAANHHHGMQAEERFGPRWTGEADFDADGHEIELTAGDVSALVAWQATLPPPTVMTPLDDRWQDAAARGSDVFDDIGCANCHRRSLPLESLVFTDPGPLDAAGTLRAGEAAELSYDFGLLKWAETLETNENGEYLVPLFADLKRHVMADRTVAALGNELLGQRFVERNVFQTAELWGVASTAPFGHRGDFSTLDGIIRVHGGDSRPARDAYVGLADAERSALIAFLKTLVIAK